MDEQFDKSSIPQSLLKENVVDKAAGKASKAIDATKAVTDRALESATHRVESVRRSLSPALDDALASVVAYTKKNPVNALAAAVAAGAILTMLLRPGRR